MFIKERRKVALFLCLLWVVIAAVSFYLIEFTGIFDQDLFRGQGTSWMGILFSLLILILGLVIFFGQIRILFPFIFFSKEDLSAYNIEKISSFLGILMIVFSYVMTFATIGGVAFWMLLIIAVAIEVLALYTSASKKFESNINDKWTKENNLAR